MSSHIDPLLQQAHDYAGEYLAGVRDRPVFPTDAAIAALARFDGPLPAQGMAGAQMLDLLHAHGSPATTAQSGGRYFGFVNGGVHPPALAARWLADAWDQNAALYVMSPIAGKLESVCEQWLAELLGLPEDTAVGLVGGTTMSLACGIAAGRDALLARQGWDVGAQGLFGAPEVKIIIGAQAHGAVLRVLSLLGLGRERVLTVPCDAQGRMRADQLPALDERSLVIVAAGNVNTGAFDPIDSVCDAAAAAGAWVHVDGAFGLWAAAAPATAPLCEGIARADSWSVDAHKTLNAPYDCGIVLARDRAALGAALQAGGAYLQWSEARDNMAYTADMSRRARGVDLWATLVTMGSSGVAQLVEQLCQHAKAFETGLREAGFRVLNEVVFNQVLVAAESPALTEATLDLLQRSGECWCGASQWNEEPVIRVSVCAAETTAADVARTVAAFAAARQQAAVSLHSLTDT